MIKFKNSSQEKIDSFSFAHWFFGRSLGFVTLIAFLSYWIQSDSLIGENGLNPWKTDLERVESFLETNKDHQSKVIIRPTLLWFSLFDNHHLLFALGSISALALTIGFMPGPSALLSWVLYLSVSVVGEPFLNFQWDALLLESLFLSVPFLPFILRHRLSKPVQYSKWARILVLLLLAKLMIQSGLVKFTYFDHDQSNAWIDFTALDFHYWTQPLPNPFSQFIHSLPHWFDLISLSAMYFIELALPLFFFLTRNWRRFALIGQVILQLSIMLSGNYGFFNLLTLVLCIPLLDDNLVPKRFRSSLKYVDMNKKTIRNGFYVSYIGALYFLFLFTSWGYLKADIQGNISKEAPLKKEDWTEEVRKLIQPLRSINPYGLFRIMTKKRPEIIIEGSANGKDWKLYDFKWKPDHANDPPQFSGPHMPRIDWQMWFEGLRTERYLSQPFSRFLYGRFLDIIANGGGQKECFELNHVFGEQEMRAFSQAPPQQKQVIISNFRNLMNTFLQQSTWFGKLLKACLEPNPVILEELESVPFVNQSPKFIRISLEHYQFQSESKVPRESVWKVDQINGGQIIIQKK